jgi:hypothetical protein
VKWPRYRPGVAQRVGRVIALLFHDPGTRRGWGVSITHRPYFTPRKDPVPIVHEAGRAPGTVWTGVENLAPTWIRSRSPDRPARSQSLYRLSYPAHKSVRCIGDLKIKNLFKKYIYVYIYTVYIVYKADHTLAARSEACAISEQSNKRSWLNISPGHCSTSKFT